MPLIDSIYTDPDKLRSLYRNPRNPLAGLDDVTAQTAASEPPPIISPPADSPPNDPFPGDDRGGGRTEIPIGDLPLISPEL